MRRYFTEVFLKNTPFRASFIALFVVIYTNSFYAKGQSDLVLTTAQDEYCTYITPTFLNINQLLFASESMYKSELESLGYVKTATGRPNEFMAKLSTRKAHFRIIAKSDRTLMMNYSPNNVDLVTTFRNSIKDMVKDLLVSHEDGYEVYKLIIPNGGLKYKVTFRLKSEVKTEYFMGRSITTDSGYLFAIID